MGQVWATPIKQVDISSRFLPPTNSECPLNREVLITSEVRRSRKYTHRTDNKGKTQDEKIKDQNGTPSPIQSIHPHDEHTCSDNLRIQARYHRKPPTYKQLQLELRRRALGDKSVWRGNLTQYNKQTGVSSLVNCSHLGVLIHQKKTLV